MNFNSSSKQRITSKGVGVNGKLLGAFQSEGLLRMLQRRHEESLAEKRNVSSLVAVEYSVAIAIDAQATAITNRHSSERQLRSYLCGLSERLPGNRRLA